jgi:hypothetical protein
MMPAILTYAERFCHFRFSIFATPCRHFISMLPAFHLLAAFFHFMLPLTPLMPRFHYIADFVDTPLDYFSTADIFASFHSIFRQLLLISFDALHADYASLRRHY